MDVVDAVGVGDGGAWTAGVGWESFRFLGDVLGAFAEAAVLEAAASEAVVFVWDRLLLLRVIGGEGLFFLIRFEDGVIGEAGASICITVSLWTTDMIFLGFISMFDSLVSFAGTNS